MITIIIHKSSNGEYREVTCKGHAGYAKTGKDIVCSAVSMLVINTINSIEQLTETNPKVVYDEVQGLIECRFTNTVDEKGQLLLDSMVLGLQNVLAEYGKKYLELKFKEV